MKVQYNTVQLNRAAQFIHEHNNLLHLPGERSAFEVRSAILSHMRDVASRFRTADETYWSATGGWILVFTHESDYPDVIDCEVYVDPSVADENSYISDSSIEVSC